MFSIRTLYELGSRRSSDSCAPQEADHNLSLSPQSTAEAKAIAASISHKEAEKRRRRRINGHIATLKAMLPDAVKTDKASLLGEAVRRVRELKKATKELEAADELTDAGGGMNCASFKPTMLTFPCEMDEVKVCRCEGAAGLIKATLCCEDRPEMVLDLIQALKAAEAKVMRAEMSTIGGRTKSVLWVELLSSSSSDNVVDVGLGRLRQALKIVLEKSAALAGSGQKLPGNKRPRFYHC